MRHVRVALRLGEAREARFCGTGSGLPNALQASSVSASDATKLYVASASSETIHEA